MLDYHKNNCALILGSSNADFTLRNFFNYKERRDFIKTLYPDIDIAGLADQHNDELWIQSLDDIIGLKYKGDIKNVLFWGGCEEDISFFVERGRNYKTLNRFDGTTPKISATEVRDALIHNRSLSGLVDQKIVNEVTDLFQTKRKLFERK
ncbi:MAG: hypothetical protein WC004_04230 [Candidatus Absconditabacterales bacterium]